MKRKRLEATLLNDSGLAPDGGEWSLSFDELAAHGRRYYSARGRAAVRVVECGPDEVVMPKRAAAVVRAAVKWYRRRLPFDLDVLDEAVARLKGRKR